MFKLALITAKKKDPNYMFQSSGIDLGTISLEAYLSRELANVDILVTEEVGDILKFGPDVVGVSATSENYPLAIRIAKEVKEKCGCAAVIGGAHITTCPESLDEIFDAGVIGEGEETLKELVELFKAGATADKYKDVRGIVYHGDIDNEKNNRTVPFALSPELVEGSKGEQFMLRQAQHERKCSFPYLDVKKGPVLAKPRPPMADLSALPIPNRKKWVDRIGMAFLMTARGCPYDCYFCAACRMWKGVRYFPVGHVISEVKDIAEAFKPKSIRFFDDVFTLDKKRVKEITSALIKEGLTKNISYFCWTRADLIDDEYVKLLKAANFVHVSFGVESASEKMMRKLKGKGIDLKKVQKGIDSLHKAGINVGCTFIIGTPGETSKELDETYAFIEKNSEKLLDVEINPLIVFPSTSLWEYAQNKGLVNADMKWEKLNDTGLLYNFDFDDYVYLNDKMPKKEFMGYVEKFKVLYKEMNFRQKNFKFSEETFPPSVFPARLKCHSSPHLGEVR